MKSGMQRDNLHRQRIQGEYVTSMRRIVILLISICISLILLSFLFPARALAHTKDTLAILPTLQVAVGFEDDSRLNYWTPVDITLNNDGPDFRGVLSATTYAGISRNVL